MVLRLAHEIRNPLATIKSAIQLVEVIQVPQGEIAEYFAGIHTEISRIDKVVRDMQQFVRLDDHAALPVRIGDVVSWAVEQGRGGGSGTEVNIVVEEGPRVEVLCDPAQLQLALEELLDNAIRFSPAGAPVRIRWRSGDGVVAVEVDDCGPGIPLELQDRILRPFFSTSTQGTGLGLNIVERVTRLMGGGLSWSNLPDGGARFCLTLPRPPT